MDIASTSTALDAFLTHWRDAAGSERANYQLFVGALCTLLDLPAPEPATGSAAGAGNVIKPRITSTSLDK